MWRAEILVPAHRIVFALTGDEVVELRGSSTFGTFGAYRGLPDAVHGMIAWPNTVLVTGAEPVIVDPGFQTQGDMLAGALAARGLSPDDVRTVLATHLHSDHVSALPQLGEVDLHVHEAELATPHARAGRGWRDRAAERPFSGASGELLPGVRWIHTPGHTDGHVAFLVETADGVVAIAGDTPGPNPSWFAAGWLPDDHPRREEHLAAFRAIREAGATVLIPGHNPPAPIVAG
jgi:glyoxylase-like metal-dependent hydrolase (beta-lactamase superfamily II)